MKKFSFALVAMLGIVATSCSQDEPAAAIKGANDNKIGFSVLADNGSRSSSAYLSGLDINTITVSAWITPAPTVDENGVKHYKSPNYDETNPNNAAYFLNDVLNRQEGHGSFDYATDARYWPSNGEVLDFFSVIDNNAWGDNGKFVFSAYDGKPGLLGKIQQLDVEEMPDMLYAYTSNKTLTRDNIGQQNVSLDYNHAFAKVDVAAEVRNSNIHVVITGIEFHGIVEDANFVFPHKVDKDGDAVDVPAQWIPGGGFTGINVPLTPGADVTEVALNLDGVNGVKEEYLIGGKTSANPYNDLLVIPNHYDGRNSSGAIQTYILLKGYAFNIADKENGISFANDSMIYGSRNSDGTFESANMLIPIEFDWKIGTKNHYRIIFDCGNGGAETIDPNDPAFVRIGYEVEVEPWTDGEDIETEYDKQTSAKK